MNKKVEKELDVLQLILKNVHLHFHLFANSSLSRPIPQDWHKTTTATTRVKVLTTQISILRKAYKFLGLHKAEHKSQVKIYTSNERNNSTKKQEFSKACQRSFKRHTNHKIPLRFL